MTLPEFAKRLGLSPDTAKRWLRNHADFRRLVKVNRTTGGHWRLQLNQGEEALRFLRLQLVMERIFHRKPLARLRIPRMGGFTLPEGWDQSNMAHATDLAGLLQDLQREMPEKNLSEISDAQFAEALALLQIMIAVFDIQKRHEKVTAKSIAVSLGISLKSLYRHPFGKSALKAARGFADASQRSANPDAIDTGEVRADSLSTKPFRAAKKRDRKEYYSDRRQDLNRCYLGWRCLFDEAHQKHSAVLWLFWENPQNGDRNTAKERRRWRREAVLTPSEIACKLVLEASQWRCMDQQPLANCHPNATMTGYEWLLSGYGHLHNGTAPTLEAAMAEVERHIQPNATKKRVLIQNLNQDGHLRIPVIECVA